MCRGVHYLDYCSQLHQIAFFWCQLWEKRESPSWSLIILENSYTVYGQQTRHVCINKTSVVTITRLVATTLLHWSNLSSGSYSHPVDTPANSTSSYFQLTLFPGCLMAVSLWLTHTVCDVTYCQQLKQAVVTHEKTEALINPPPPRFNV